jgi:hypothetical protein
MSALGLGGVKTPTPRKKVSYRPHTFDTVHFSRKRKKKWKKDLVMTDLDSLLDQIKEKQKMEGQIQLSTNATSLDLLPAIYRDNRQPLQRRMRAAIACLPFERPKCAVVAQTATEDLAVRMQQALEARM